MKGQQICDPLTTKFNHVKLFVTWTTPRCNLISSLHPHPVYGHRTSWLGTSVLDYVRTCLHWNFKNANFVSYHLFSFILDMVLLAEIFARGMLLHAYDFSFIHVMFSHYLNVRTQKSRQKFSDIYISKKQNKSKQMSLIQDSVLYWLSSTSIFDVIHKARLRLSPPYHEHCQKGWLSAI